MKTREEIKAQIIKDNVGINHENDRALYYRIIKEFVKRGFPLTYDLFDKDYHFVIYDEEEGNVNAVDYNYAKNFSLNIITLEEFIKRYPIEERELIGWNFKDVETVSNCFTNNLLKRDVNKGYDFISGSIREDCLKKLGVLEILCEPVYEEQSKPDEFETAIKELGFVRNEKLSDRLMIEHKEYLLEYEGYAYVLYKIINKELPSAKLQLKEPIAHFQDANKLRAFVNILKDQF